MRNSRNERAVMSTVVGHLSLLNLTEFFPPFFFFGRFKLSTVTDMSVIKSDISDTLGCAQEVTSSKAFIIRCMTDLNIYKICFNN